MENQELSENNSINQIIIKLDLITDLFNDIIKDYNKVTKQTKKSNKYKICDISNFDVEKSRNAIPKD